MQILFLLVFLLLNCQTQAVKKRPAMSFPKDLMKNTICPWKDVGLNV